MMKILFRLRKAKVEPSERKSEGETSTSEDGDRDPEMHWGNSRNELLRHFAVV